MRVLLVEDERGLSAAICQVLRREHIQADAVFTGTEGLDSARSGIYDAVILDVMLPGKDGFSILKELRGEGSGIPVLMLTARGDVEDRVFGLDSGADYYLAKPFQMSELIACLGAITRRREAVPVQELHFGDVTLMERLATLHCSATGQSVKLGAKEQLLLEILLRNPRQILPKEMLIERVWGFESDAEYNNLEVYISFVRRKLAFIGSALKIKATRGLGYALEDTP